MRQLKVLDRSKSRILESLLMTQGHLKYNNVREIVSLAKSNLGYATTARVTADVEEECLRLCHLRGVTINTGGGGVRRNTVHDISVSLCGVNIEESSNNADDLHHDCVFQLFEGQAAEVTSVTALSKRFDKSIKKGSSVPSFPKYGLNLEKTAFDDNTFKNVSSGHSKTPGTTSTTIPEDQLQTAANEVCQEVSEDDESESVVSDHMSESSQEFEFMSESDSSQLALFAPPAQVQQQRLPPLTFSSGTFADKYTLGEELGDGAFSVVQEAISKETGVMYAVKIITTNDDFYMDQMFDSSCSVDDEISMLQELNHPNILSITDVYLQDNSTYYLVSDLMSGGELLDRIAMKEVYNEDDARTVTKTLLGALSYLHDRRIVHRDLKPENLLLRSRDSDCDVLIADFGFAKKIQTPNSLTTKCGSPGYVAPEILDLSPSDQQGYDVECDMWSFGVILYILLGGYAPFEDDNMQNLRRKIQMADYEFHDKFWSTVSQDAKDLVSSFMTLDVTKRMTAKEALESNQWINASKDRLRKLDRTESLAVMKRFTMKQKLRAAVHTITAANKMQNLLNIR